MSIESARLLLEVPLKQVSDGQSGVHHLDSHLLNAVENLFLMTGQSDSNLPKISAKEQHRAIKYISVRVH